MTYMRTTAVHLMQPIAGVLKSTPMLLMVLPLDRPFRGCHIQHWPLGPWGFQAFLPHGAKLV